jgi:uncharacterized protein (DUF1778 family)
MGDARLSIRVSQNYLWQVKQLAAMERKTVTQVVLEAIAEYAEARAFTIYPDPAEREGN